MIDLKLAMGLPVGEENRTCGDRRPGMPCGIHDRDERVRGPYPASSVSWQFVLPAILH